MIFDSTPATQDFGWKPRGFHPEFPSNDGRRSITKT
jgi:hypothetical protein